MGMPVIVPSGVDRCQAITDIIESVALEQAALAHILNAEGEKLQHIISVETDTTVLLEANKSIRSMVDTVARLEMILQSKLGLFEESLNDDCTVTETETETETKTKTKTETETESQTNP